MEIHHDQIGFGQGDESAVEDAAVVQVEKQGFGMKPFQRRVFVVAVNRDMSNALVLEELDIIDGKETFADTPLAVKDENQSFHWVMG
jgi:hypothetical protein